MVDARGACGELCGVAPARVLHARCHTGIIYMFYIYRYYIHVLNVHTCLYIYIYIYMYIYI